MIKSDAFHNGCDRAILNEIRNKGYIILHAMRWQKLPRDVMEAFYHEHIDRPYFPDLRRSVEETVQAMLLEKPDTACGVDPISEFRNFIGNTNNAREADVNSIRARFGGHNFDPEAPRAFNAIHGSDSPSAVVREACLMLGYQPDVIIHTVACGGYRLADYAI
jgi:nucleoside diphosphate kinase